MNQQSNLFNMSKINFDSAAIGTALFEAVSSGKITTREYHKAIDGIQVIKSVIKCTQ